MREQPVIVGDPNLPHVAEIESSCGMLHVDKDGNVVYCKDEGRLAGNPYRGFKPYLSLITKFNMDEFREHWKREPGSWECPEDILDFGYWNVKDGVEVYEEPAYDYRESQAE